MLGGSGTVIGAFFGALVLAILTDGFALIGVSADPLFIVFGAAVLVAMVANVQLGRLREAGGRCDDRRPHRQARPHPPSADGDVLRVEHIAKRYGAVTALTDVNLHLRRGEVLGLIGDNGAGKSTLLKILCGFQPPTCGQIFLEGQEVTLKSVDHARSLGIDAVYQDLALVNQLSVFHNMFLNREKVRWPLLNNRSCGGRPGNIWTDGVRIPSVTARWPSFPAGSGRRSRWPARSTPTRRSCCSTSRWPPWGSRRAPSSWTWSGS